MSGQLERLLAQATPGPWMHRRNEGAKLWRWILSREWAVAAVPVDTAKELPNARLIALAPDLGWLLVDAMAALHVFEADFPCLDSTSNAIGESCGECAGCEGRRALRSLFARFAVLEQRAGEGQA